MKNNNNIDNQSTENNNKSLDADLCSASGGVVPLFAVGYVATSVSTKVVEGAKLNNILGKLDVAHSMDKTNKGLKEKKELQDEIKQRFDKSSPEEKEKFLRENT